MTIDPTPMPADHPRRGTVSMLQTLLIVCVLVTLTACASAGHRPPQLPPHVDPEHAHFTEAAAEEGEPAPEISLPSPDGTETFTLSEERGTPVVLVFGSFT